MRQFVHLRASPTIETDIHAFATAIAPAFPGRVVSYHPSVADRGGPNAYWRSEYEFVTDRFPERLVPDYARRYLAVKDSLGDISGLEFSFVIVTEVANVDDMKGYYLSRDALALLVQVGWDVDIDVVPEVGTTDNLGLAGESSTFSDLQ